MEAVLSDSKDILYSFTILSTSHSVLWRITALRSSSTAFGTGVPDTSDSSSTTANSSFPSTADLPLMASKTLWENLYGLAVDAITVLV